MAGMPACREPVPGSGVLCISRKSVNRPSPWLFNLANAETKRSRSPVVRPLASLRMRTITGTEPTSVVATRASILTSPSLTLGCFPAAKNGTVVPSTGMVSVTLLENAPVVPALNTTAPPLADEAPEIFTLTVGVLTPEGLVTRIRHGDGDHERNRASAAVLLLICSSTSMVLPPKLVNRAAMSTVGRRSKRDVFPRAPTTFEYSRCCFLYLLDDVARLPGPCRYRLFGNRNCSVQPITFGRKVTTIPRGQQAGRCISPTLVAK